jgi:RNase P/RNase MRP subunit p30
LEFRLQPASNSLKAELQLTCEWTMPKTVTSRYDVADHLRTPEEMAAYLEACLEEAHTDAVFITKATRDIASARNMGRQKQPTDPSHQ